MVDELKLFDDFAREYLETAKYSEPRWGYFNRTARPGFQYVRELLQGWFDDYQEAPDKRYRLWKDFCSDNDTQHLGAFFELYLYQLFKRQGFNVEVEPEWEKRRPDFLLTSPKGEKILLEATGTYPTIWYGSAEKLRQATIDYLNENLDSPDFFLQIEIVSTSPHPLPSKRLSDDLRKWLAQLDYHQVISDLGGEPNDLGNFPSITWRRGAWTINFIAIPKKETARGKDMTHPIAARFYGVHYVDTASSIKSRINEKYGRYGELRIPYILALNVVDAYADEDSIISALFGQEGVRFNWDTNETLPYREPNGAWIGPDGYQKQRMSAICVFNQLYPENMHLKGLTLWHHPAANHPLHPELLNLTQQIPNFDLGHYEQKDGNHPSEFLSIDKTKMPI